MKQIKDLFLPYEHCVKLKQLGFNLECLATYYTDIESNIVKEYDYRKQLNVEYYEESGGYINSETRLDYVTAPTYDQFFTWLRDTHNIDAWVQPYVQENGLYKVPYLSDESYSYFIFKDGSFVSDKCDLLDFKEAQKELVKEVIKHLENKLNLK